MILELGEGRELQLPDEMSDETARQLKRFILTLEERARNAEATVRALQDEMAALRQKFDTIQAQPADTSAADAVKELRTALERGVRAIVAAARADRVMVADEYGEYTRSKAL